MGNLMCPTCGEDENFPAIKTVSAIKGSQKFVDKLHDQDATKFTTVLSTRNMAGIKPLFLMA
jgi:hypothetical protein